MNIMAIDPGIAKCGFAIGEKPNKIKEYGTIYTSSKDGELDQRISIITDKIYRKIEEYNIKKILIEQFRVFNSYNSSVHKTIELIGAIKEGVRVKYGIPVFEINHKRWQARYETVINSKVYPYFTNIYGEEWEKALNEGSEHSRDAVKILLIEVFSVSDIISEVKKRYGRFTHNNPTEC